MLEKLSNVIIAQTGSSNTNLLSFMVVPFGFYSHMQKSTIFYFTLIPKVFFILGTLIHSLYAVIIRITNACYRTKVLFTWCNILILIS
jgi:hypothetical protein